MRRHGLGALFMHNLYSENNYNEQIIQNNETLESNEQIIQNNETLESNEQIIQNNETLESNGDTNKYQSDIVNTINKIDILSKGNINETKEETNTDNILYNLDINTDKLYNNILVNEYMLENYMEKIKNALKQIKDTKYELDLLKGNNTTNKTTEVENDNEENSDDNDEEQSDDEEQNDIYTKSGVNVLDITNFDKDNILSIIKEDIKMI
jgi:hypothetical protein